MRRLRWSRLLTGGGDAGRSPPKPSAARRTTCPTAGPYRIEGRRHVLRLAISSCGLPRLDHLSPGAARAVCMWNAFERWSLAGRTRPRPRVSVRPKARSDRPRLLAGPALRDVPHAPPWPTAPAPSDRYFLVLRSVARSRHRARRLHPHVLYIRLGRRKESAPLPRRRSFDCAQHCRSRGRCLHRYGVLSIPRALNTWILGCPRLRGAT